MRILAIETIGQYGSLAALDGARLLRTLSLAGSLRTARTLAPGIRDLLQQVGWNPGDVELVAVAVGPGSFTGLRLGVTTAKTFAYARRCAIQGVDSLLAIAEQAPPAVRDVHVAIDAQRQQVFATHFVRGSDGTFTPTAAMAIVDHEAWLQSLPPACVVHGPAIAMLGDRLPGYVQTTPAESWLPTAETVGRLGYLHYQAGQQDDVFRLTPQYGRASAAEEKRDAATGSTAWSPRPRVSFGKSRNLAARRAAC